MPRNEFNFGLQTITHAALEAAGRRFNREHFEVNFDKLVKHFADTNITIDLICGLPGDSLDGFMASLDYAIALDKVRRILTNPLIALPGSRFFREQKRYGIELVGTRTYLVERSNTFFELDMDAARRISFYVSLLYVNAKFPAAFRTEAANRKMRVIDFVNDFFGQLSFLETIKAPDMVPTMVEGFRQRNTLLAGAISKYDDIIREFNSVATTPVLYFQDAFTDHYHKLINLISK